MSESWLAELPKFTIVLARCAGAVLLLPPWNWRTAPLAVRLGLGTALAVALTPILASRVPAPTGSGPLVACIVNELVIGLSIGLVGMLVFWGLLVAGQLLQAYIAGPPAASGESESLGPLTELYYLLGLIIFIAMGGHRWLVRELYESFSVLPAGATLAAAGLTTGVTAAASRMFLIGLVMAAPAITALFLADVALAAVARSVPGIPWNATVPALRWPVALVALVMTVPLLAQLVSWQLQTIQSSLAGLLGGS